MLRIIAQIRARIGMLAKSMDTDAGGNHDEDEEAADAEEDAGNPSENDADAVGDSNDEAETSTPMECCGCCVFCSCDCAPPSTIGKAI